MAISNCMCENRNERGVSVRLVKLVYGTTLFTWFAGGTTSSASLNGTPIEHIHATSASMGLRSQSHTAAQKILSAPLPSTLHSDSGWPQGVRYLHLVVLTSLIVVVPAWSRSCWQQATSFRFASGRAKRFPVCPDASQVPLRIVNPSSPKVRDTCNLSPASCPLHAVLETKGIPARPCPLMAMIHISELQSGSVREA